MIDTTSPRFRAAWHAFFDESEGPTIIALAVAIAKWEESNPYRIRKPTEADQDGHPYWVCWTDSVGTWYDKARYADGIGWTFDTAPFGVVTPDLVMRLPMGNRSPPTLAAEAGDNADA